jgi:site-specific DNA recombinase
MIAAIYARKSTEQNGVGEEAKSVTRQIEHARAYATRQGWIVAAEHVYQDDGISGAEFVKRPGFVRLMNALKPAPPFQVLVMSEASRLGREQIEVAYVMKQLSQAGVRVYGYLDGRELALNSPTDKLLLSVTAFADEMEREKARQRTRDALLRRARAGAVAGGRVYGYENVPVLGPDGKRTHSERRIVEPEAATVRRLFALCAEGFGFCRIAQQLNRAGAPAPRPTKGGPTGWAPSVVRAALYRRLYIGELVWGRTAKRDAWGRLARQQRAKDDWLIVPVPHLRLVADDVWTAAHERLARSRTAYLRHTNGRVWGKPTLNGVESKYLLTGLAVCGLCGGALTARVRTHRGQPARWYYRCLCYVQRGLTVCPNRYAMARGDADRAVIAAVTEGLLVPRVIVAAVEEALRRLAPSPADRAREDTRLRQRLAGLDAELARYTAAVGVGGDLPSLVAALHERERQRVEVHAELAAHEALAQVASLDLARVERELGDLVTEWRELLVKTVASGRQILRKLLAGRLRFTPRVERGVLGFDFEGEGLLTPLLVGTVLPKASVPPG